MPIPLPTSLFPYWFFPWNTDTWSGFTSFVSHKELLAIDAIRQIYIWKEFAATQILHGSLPFWNPHNFSGQPLLANFQSAVFYPLSWIYLFLPTPLAWSIFIYCQPVLFGLFIYLFLVNRLKSKLPALFGSFTIVFASFFATRYFWGVYLHPIIWLPLGLFIIDRFNSRKLLAFLIPVLALTILGGYPQHASFSLIVIFSYFIFQKSWKKIHLFLFSLLIALTICAVQLVPTFNLYKNSLREGPASIKSASSQILTPEYFVTLLAPDYFGSPATNNFTGWADYSGANNYFGILALVFAIYALKKTNREIRFWTALGVLGLLFAYRSPIAELPIILKIPILSSGGPWNNLFFFQFSAGIISAYGLKAFLTEKNRVLLFGIASVVFCVLLLLILQKPVIMRSSLSSLLPLLVMLLIIPLSKKSFFPYFIVMISAFSGLYYLFKMSPFGDSRYLYPPHPLTRFLESHAGVNRFWGYKESHFASNFATHYRIYSIEGYDSLWPKWYGELLFSAPTGKLPKVVERADMVLTPIDSERREKILNLLGVKYLLDRSEKPEGDDGQNILKFPKEKYNLVRQWGPVSIYENKKAQSRAFVTGKFEIERGSKAISRLYSPDFDASKKIILAEDPGVVDPGASGSAKIVSYEPSTISIKSISTGRALLFLSDTYFPGWQVSVNGKPAKLLKADYAFRAVSIPKGTSVVTFVYYSEYFIESLIISSIGILLWLSLFLKPSRFYGR